MYMRLYWILLTMSQTKTQIKNDRTGTCTFLTQLPYNHDHSIPLKAWHMHNCGHDCMVVGFATTYAISTYHHYLCEFKSRSRRGVLDKTLCDKVCQ